MTRRVLITGATGFVGQHLLPRLLDTFDQVHALARHPPETLPESSPEVSNVSPPPTPPAAHWHRIDLLHEDSAPLLRAIRPTHLIHLAWIATPGEYWTSPRNADWLKVSKALFDAFVEIGGRRIVGVGTCAEYDWSAGLCDEATTPLAPASIYGRSKAELSRYLNDLPISSAWARLFWPFGPGEPGAKLTTHLVTQMLLGRPAKCSAGLQQRDFIFIDDVAEALVRLLDSAVIGGVNIGAGRAVAVRELALRLGELVGRPDLLRFAEPNENASDPPLVVAKIDRLSQEVGFAPTHDLQSGLRRTVERLRASR